MLVLHSINATLWLIVGIFIILAGGRELGAILIVLALLAKVIVNLMLFSQRRGQELKSPPLDFS